LYVGPVHVADTIKSSEKSRSGKFTVDPKEIQKPWTAHLDGMIARRTFEYSRSIALIMDAQAAREKACADKIKSQSK